MLLKIQPMIMVFYNYNYVLNTHSLSTVVQVPHTAVNTTVNPAYTTVVLTGITPIYELVQ